MTIFDKQKQNTNFVAKTDIAKTKKNKVKIIQHDFVENFHNIKSRFEIIILLYHLIVIICIVISL